MDTLNCQRGWAYSLNQGRREKRFNLLEVAAINYDHMQYTDILVLNLKVKKSILFIKEFESDSILFIS